jgi:DNA-binding transcriptional regulator YiaG
MYQVSNLGRIRSLDRYVGYKNNKLRLFPGKILNQTIITNGYYKVVLSKNSKMKNYSVHRLIILSFLSNPNNYEFANHKDGNKLNNNVDNLEWCNRSQNQIHAYRNGLQKVKHGKDVNGSKLTEEMVKIIRKSITLSQYELANIFGVCQQTISDIQKLKRWKYLEV